MLKDTVKREPAPRSGEFFEKNGNAESDSIFTKSKKTFNETFNEFFNNRVGTGHVAS